MIFDHKFQLARERSQPIAVASIQDLVARHFELDREQLLSPIQHRYIARPRQIAMYLTKGLTDLSTQQIARLFRKRNHTTILHAVQMIEREIPKSIQLYADIEALADRLIEQ